MDIDATCAAFDLGTPTAALSYVARGELGRVSRLATTAGMWAIKEVELFVPTVEEADANVSLQESMLAAGVDLPRPRRTVEGHGIFGNIRVYEWLELSALPDGDLAGEEMVAATLARMHRHAPATDAAPDPWYVETLAKNVWNELVGRGASSWWAPILAALVPELVDLAPPDHSPTRVCHLDVCPENVFLSGDRLTVIDWENAGPAATRQDLGSTLWDFCRGYTTRTRVFVDHYRRHGGPIERFDASVFDTARVVQANLIDFHARRALDPRSTPERRERAERALRAGLARPLTRALVDDLVD
jgi:Ser/Thr protein kinase RdoA (MazF antagonist)